MCGVVEVGEHVAGSTFQGPTERAEFGEGGRDASADRLDHLGQGSSPGGLVGVAVGAHLRPRRDTFARGSAPIIAWREPSIRSWEPSVIDLGRCSID